MKRVAPLLPLAAVAFYAFFIEPSRFEVTRHAVKAPLQKPIKLAHLTDLHLRGFGSREEKLLALVEAEKPDAVLITGDNVTGSAEYRALETFLGRLKAPLGVWVTRGNWDHWAPPEGKKDEPFTRAGARLLDNAPAQLSGKIWLAGLDDAYVGRPDLDAALKGIPKNSFILALFHSPAFFTLAAPKISLALAGHTHGGQIRLPYLPPLYLPPRSRPFIEGWYALDGARLYVSRGLGTSLVHARLFCRPELAIVTLEPF